MEGKATTNSVDSDSSTKTKDSTRVDEHAKDITADEEAKMVLTIGRDGTVTTTPSPIPPPLPRRYLRGGAVSVAAAAVAVVAAAVAAPAAPETKIVTPTTPTTL